MPRAAERLYITVDPNSMQITQVMPSGRRVWISSATIVFYGVGVVGVFAAIAVTPKVTGVMAR